MWLKEEMYNCGPTNDEKLAWMIEHFGDRAPADGKAKNVVWNGAPYVFRANEFLVGVMLPSCLADTANDDEGEAMVDVNDEEGMGED